MSEALMGKRQEAPIVSSTKYYMDQVSDMLASNQIVMDDEQKQDVMIAVQTMNRVLTQNGLSFNDVDKFDKSNILDVLEKVATMKLNTSAIPAECYMRLVKTFKVTMSPDGTKNTNYNIFGWTFDFGLQGAGYEKTVAKYGVGVKKVYQPWIIRDGDDFKYPHYKGIDIVPPEWTPKGTGNAVRVVYPVEMEDKTVQYLISEREDVRANLMAHISNNLLGKKNEEIKKKVLSECEGKKLDEILADKEICEEGKVSPAWRGSTSEAMIITKMKNNALKPFPKNFGNTFITSEYAKADKDDETVPATGETVVAPSIDVTADKSSVKQIASENASITAPLPKGIEVKTPAKEEKVENGKYGSISTEGILRADAGAGEAKDDDESDPDDKDVPF